MQHRKPSIQLSDHVKSKLRQHQPTPFSLSSNELALSDNTDDDNGNIRRSLISFSILLNSFLRFTIA
jgi:hypothetical protein